MSGESAHDFSSIDSAWDNLNAYLNSHLHSCESVFSLRSPRVMPLPNLNQNYVSQINSNLSAQNQTAFNKEKLLHILKNVIMISQEDLKCIGYNTTQSNGGVQKDIRVGGADNDMALKDTGELVNENPNRIFGPSFTSGDDLELDLRRQQRILYRFQLNFMPKNTSKFIESYRIREASIGHCINYEKNATLHKTHGLEADPSPNSISSTRYSKLQGTRNRSFDNMRPMTYSILFILALFLLVVLHALALYCCVLLTVYQIEDRQLFWLYCCITWLIVDCLMAETAFIVFMYILLPSIVYTSVTYAKLVVLGAVKR